MAGEGTVPPVMLMALPLDVTSLRMVVYFLGAIVIIEEIFLGRFWVFREGRSWV